jgi:sterol desaturase/sphingolipid hydroxylase (fatty acid hydroxylase superfamily)
VGSTAGGASLRAMRRPDLTVLAIPAFVGAMAAEYAWQRRHPAPPGTVRAGDYALADTMASLTMGVGSLVAPFVTTRLLDPVTPGVGRHARLLMGTAVATSAATTVLDVVRRRRAHGRLPDAGTLPPGAGRTPRTGSDAVPRPPDDTLLRRVDGATAAAAVASTALTVATTWSAQTSGTRLFARSRRDLGTGWVANAVAILGWDAIYYWNHRLNHESRWLWAMHVVHHSSERYNLSTALRQPVAEGLTMSVPYGILALAGVRPSVIENARALNLIYQFWIHTEAVRSIGWLENVLNTPSHHRVHHGRNPRYVDRNHGGTLIVWDRLFGTFAEERGEPVYGITRPLASWNPLWANLHYWVEMWEVAQQARRPLDRLQVLWKAPGWRPEDLGGFVAAPEVDRASYQRYDTRACRAVQIYVLVQFAVVLGGSVLFLHVASRLSSGASVAAAIAILVSLLSLGGLLDRRRWAKPLEAARLVAAVVATVLLATGVRL